MIPALKQEPWPAPRIASPLPAAPAGSCGAGAAPAAARAVPFDRFEQAFRYGNDFVIQLAAGDAPTLLAVGANLAPLPGPLAAGLGVLNALNVITNGLGLAADLRGVYRCERNPAATRKDRLYDWIHIALGDVAPLAGSIMPLVMSIQSPVAMGVFAGLQLVGVGCDIWKTVYDVQRKGQQSAYVAAPT